MFSRGLRWLYERYRRRLEVRNFRRLLDAYKGDIKVVIGASELYQKGWLPSEAHFLNLLIDKHWRRFFKEDSIRLLLAEHVWEHLSPEDGYKAACTCYKYLQKGGKLRVAVPDGFHSDSSYIEYVKPGGTGAGADDHKVLYNYKTLSAVFQKAGFEIRLLEYFNEDKKFIKEEWLPEEGYVHRSIRFDERNKDGNPHYTSLIIDAVKS